MLNLKKSAVAAIAAAFILIAGLTHQAKAFTVNDTDLYLILSNNSTEYYLDLGAKSLVLASGGSWNITSGVSTAAVGGFPEHWTIGGGDSGTGFSTLYLSYQGTGLNGYTNGSVTNGLTQWLSFEGNTCASCTTSMTQTKSAGNSYYNLFDGTGLGTGTFGQSVPGTPGANGTIGQTSMLNLYQGNISTNAFNLLSMVATVTGNATQGYTLTIGNPVVTPLPPSLVMFVTGIIALFVIARRKEASI